MHTCSHFLRPSFKDCHKLNLTLFFTGCFSECFVLLYVSQAEISAALIIINYSFDMLRNKINVLSHSCSVTMRKGEQSKSCKTLWSYLAAMPTSRYIRFIADASL